MVFAVAVLTDARSAEALEVEAGCVHEHQVQPAEQVAPVCKQLLLDQILGAARRKWHRIILLLGGQCFTEPGHGTVEVVQVEIFAAADAIVLTPAIRRQIRTAAHQAMQHSEEHRAFHCEAMAALARNARDHVLAASFLPQPLEQQGGADAAHRDRWGFATACGIQHHSLPHEACSRAQQSIELAAGFKFIQPSQRGNHPLADLIAGAMALHDLQIDATLRLLAAEIHARLDGGAHRITRTSLPSSRNAAHTWHYIFGKYTTCTQSDQ